VIREVGENTVEKIGEMGEEIEEESCEGERGRYF
jgi:hypothetical protein